MCFDFLYNFVCNILCATFLILRRIERDAIINVLRSSYKVPAILARYQGHLGFLEGFPKKILKYSSVGIETRCGLDRPGIESRLGRDFQHPSSPALGPTQPPIQWVPGLSRG
jgi:hypothetical protein